MSVQLEGRSFEQYGDPVKAEGEIGVNLEEGACDSCLSQASPCYILDVPVEEVVKRVDCSPLIPENASADDPGETAVALYGEVTD